MAKAKRFVETSAPTPAPRRTLLFISNGYVDDGDIQDAMSELVQSAVQHGVRIVAIDAKVFSSALGTRADAEAWNRYVAASKAR